MYRSKLEPERLEIHVAIDGEGVVRVIQSTTEEITLNTHELGQLLTALVKSFVSTSDDEDEFDVRLN
jgi:hypothetical protein